MWRQVAVLEMPQSDLGDQALERGGEDFILPFRAKHHDGCIGRVETRPVPRADDRPFRQPQEQREVVAQQAAIEDRGRIGELSDEIEAADAAPWPSGEPRGEINQQCRRLGAGWECPADAVEVDTIGMIGQCSHLFGRLRSGREVDCRREGWISAPGSAQRHRLLLPLKIAPLVPCRTRPASRLGLDAAARPSCR